eukprot:TRINITY_DN60822_c0_g1_i1.p1 TRINITY_DN60822_c0_g1~~TRINITY_DN60822_c0_g1_i1.p1  ORF type:complete len:691 (+),score=275.74 TRINITY_DN60822_c0_g1_i1:100-2172(+)
MAGDPDTIRILVATDNHLGAFEKSPVRRDDAFVTFEEILIKARELEVDFLLLGGDLFDENKPSHVTLHRAMQLFRKYCMGSRPVQIRLLSDPRRDFSNGGFPTANFLDPNLNVALPVFAIHGNHDDPVGERQMSAMDLLSVSGLVNYFGKAAAADDIEVSPVLIAKGETRLALYGLGHVRDERLHRSFEHGKVRFAKPAEAPETWFNLFVLHQNRGTRGYGTKNGVQEEQLAGHFDLVIWGHEHEQRAHTERSVGDTYDILQPGSSVIAGPKSVDDMNRKQVCLLEIRDTSYRVVPFPLLSARPVEFRHVTLSDEEGLERTPQEVTEHLANIVEEMIKKSKDQVLQIPDHWLQLNPNLKFPLVRMKIDYSPDFPVVNPTVFGSRFVNRVANPQHMILSVKKSAPSRSAGGADGGGAHPGAAFGAGPFASSGGTMADRISASIHQFINETDKRRMSMMSELGLTESLRQYVDKGENPAIQEHVSKYLERAQRTMWKDVKKAEVANVKEDQLKELAQQIRDTAEGEIRRDGVAAPGAPPAAGAAAAAAAPLPAAPAAPAPPPAEASAAGDDMPPQPPCLLVPAAGTPQDGDVLSATDAVESQPAAANGRGGRGGGRGGRGRGGGASQKRSAAAAALDPNVPPSQPRGGAGAKRKRGGAAAAAAAPAAAAAADAAQGAGGAASILAHWGKKKK